MQAPGASSTITQEPAAVPEDMQHLPPPPPPPPQPTTQWQREFKVKTKVELIDLDDFPSPTSPSTPPSASHSTSPAQSIQPSFHASPYPMSRSYHLGSPSSPVQLALEPEITDDAMQVEQDVVPMEPEVVAMGVEPTTLDGIWLPSKRIFGKQPAADVVWRRVLPMGVVQAKYRTMCYCTHHSVAIRQRHWQKKQVGSTKLPPAMPKQKGIDLCKAAMQHIHPGVEALCSALLRLAVAYGA
eukprot:193934-Amphidinium_carterae.1